MKNGNGFGGIRKLTGKRRKPYQVVVTVSRELVDGKMKQIQKTIGYTATRNEALIMLAEYNKCPYDISREATFEDIYKALDKSRMKTQTIRALVSAYGKCDSIKDMKIKDIKKPQLQKIADSLSQKSTSTQMQVRILWNHIFRYAMENDLIQKSYDQYVRFYSDYKSKAKEPFSVKEVEMLSDDLQILCYTGLRISEYLSLTEKDIKNGCIYLRGTKTAAAVRIIPIHPKIAVRLSQRLTEGFQMGYDKYKRTVFQPEMEKLGITGHTIHDTRRTFATYADRSGMNDDVIKRIMGHKITDITKRVYTTKYLDELKKEMNKFEIV